jgi:RNA polymerase-interacting CarD/CdnL/TRCF family regulator
MKKDLDDQVREILTEDEAHEIIEYLSSFDDKLAKNWKKRNRNNKERLTSGDPRELCAVAKGLMKLKNKRKAPLSNGDRAQLQKAFRLLAEELGRVLDEEPEIMEEKLRETCIDSIAA